MQFISDSGSHLLCPLPKLLINSNRLSHKITSKLYGKLFSIYLLHAIVWLYYVMLIKIYLGRIYILRHILFNMFFINCTWKSWVLLIPLKLISIPCKTVPIEWSRTAVVELYLMFLSDLLSYYNINAKSARKISV